MDPHPLASLFKRSNYDEPITSEVSSLDYLYEVLLEIYGFQAKAYKDNVVHSNH